MIFLHENYTKNYSGIIIENQDNLFSMKLNHFEKVNSFKTAVSLTNKVKSRVEARVTIQKIRFFDF